MYALARHDFTNEPCVIDSWIWHWIGCSKRIAQMVNSRTPWYCRLIAALMLAAGLWLVCGVSGMRSEFDRLRAEAGFLLAQQDYRSAESIVERLLNLKPADEWSRLFAAELAAHRYKTEESLNLYSGLTDSSNRHIALRARIGVAERQYYSGNLKASELACLSALALEPRALTANRRMANVLYLQGRTWEARPYLEELVRQGDFIADELVMLSSTEQWVTEASDYRSKYADNIRLELGMAKIASLQNLNEEALERLGRITAAEPELGEAQAILGKTLLALGDRTSFEAWKVRLTPSHLQHPEVWQALALDAQQTGRHEEVIRCCVEVLKRNPFHGVATYQLSQELSRAGEFELAGEMLERSRRISDISIQAGDLRQIVDFQMMRRVSELQLELGRNLEAAGWADLAHRFGPNEDWHSTVHKIAMSKKFSNVGEVPGLDEVQKIAARLSDTSSLSTPPIVASLSSERIQFEDVAATKGLIFQYDIGKDIDAGMEHIFETTGGGVAVIDFDLDTRPDVYFSQSCDWMKVPDPNAKSNQLFRNRVGEEFLPCTDVAGVSEFRFSQGVTAGDFDNDGFPDLYVCNLGENSCFRSNGDGTFTEVATTIGASSDLWSLSAAFADLNDDSFPDLYVVNYLNAAEVAARSCKHEGQPRSCAPTMFSGAEDRLFLNDGAGNFRDVSEESGVSRLDGKGLAIQIADFLDDGRLSVYVGNDTIANFLYVRSGITNQGVPLFNEEATTRGLAYNDKGQAQATMGITVADINGDRLLDLFATNFYQDANTFYVQTPEHYFEEKTRESNLYDSSFYMLGFGAQFIDATCSGLSDLFVTNGHVDRTFATGEPDRMVPHFYRNQGNGTFAVEGAESIGPYFSLESLGRAMAVFDWNNDGLTDVLITHLDRPAALLSNVTNTSSQFLCVTLVGVKSARAPIGAALELETSDGTVLYKQLTTGDGYQVRNDQRVHFGLGTNEARRVTIRWPGNHTETFEIPVQSRFITIVEGQGVFLQP